MNTNLPNDPVILVSYLNTQLRDFYSSLDELCKAFDIKKDAVEQKLAAHRLSLQCRFKSVSIIYC